MSAQTDPDSEPIGLWPRAAAGNTVDAREWVPVNKPVKNKSVGLPLLLLVTGAVLAAFVLNTARSNVDVQNGGPASEEDFRSPNKQREGVVAVWKQGQTLAKNEVPQATLGDELVVRVRNLDGWLTRKVNEGRIPAEPYLTESLRKVWISAVEDAADMARGNPRKDFGVMDVVEDLRARESRLRGGVENTLTALKKTVADLEKGLPATSAQLEQAQAKLAAETEKQKDKLKQADTLADRAAKTEEALRGFEDLHRAAKAGLYLMLGSAQLRTVKASNDFANAQRGPSAGDSDIELIFNIRRDKEDDAEWKKVFAKAARRTSLPVSLGLKLGDHDYTLPTAVGPDAKAKNQQFHYLFFEWPQMSAALVIVLGGFYAFLKLAGSGDILRDADAPRRPDGFMQYSLARSQMAFWFFLVFSAFLFLWVVTLRMDTLNNTALILIGIGGATALGASAITQMVRKGPAPTDESLSLHYVARVPKGGGKPDTEDGYLARRGKSLEALRGELQKRYSKAAGIEAENLARDLEYLSWGPLRQMFQDWLTDGNRVMLHRFQMIMWTLVLGFVFVVRVAQDMEMPEFSETLLALLGISGGTYLGFKAQEVSAEKAADNAGPVKDGDPR